MKKKSKYYQINSIVKVFKIIETLVLKPEWDLAEIAKQTGIQKTTVHRMLLTLRSLGYVEQNPKNKRYAGSISFFEIGCKVIGGLDYPEKGSVQFLNQEISGFSKGSMAQYRNQQIGFVFQFHHLLPQCTLLENVLVPTLLDTKSRKVNSDRAEALMKRVGIWEFRDKMPSKLSGGECQRAAVVRAMINSPSLLLADEPTGALDRENVKSMADLLIELNKEDGLTLLIVTHATDLAKRMGKTMELRNGKLEII